MTITPLDWVIVAAYFLFCTAIGLFFNIVVPGLTGGDLVKAVLAARDHPERKAAAMISVLVDRLIGVLVLVLLGAVAILA